MRLLAGSHDPLLTREGLAAAFLLRPLSCDSEGVCLQGQSTCFCLRAVDNGGSVYQLTARPVVGALLCLLLARQPATKPAAMEGPDAEDTATAEPEAAALQDYKPSQQRHGQYKQAGVGLSQL